MKSRSEFHEGLEVDGGVGFGGWGGVAAFVWSVAPCWLLCCLPIIFCLLAARASFVVCVDGILDMPRHSSGLINIAVTGLNFLINHTSKHDQYVVVKNNDHGVSCTS